MSYNHIIISFLSLQSKPDEGWVIIIVTINVTLNVQVSQKC